MSVTIYRQREEALERANEIRTVGRQIKEDLAPLDFNTGLQEIARLLRDDPDRIAGLRIHALLDAVPMLGDAGIRWLLTRPEFPIWPLRRCRELTERQRLWLAGQLERMAASGRRRVR